MINHVLPISNTLIRPSLPIKQKKKKRERKKKFKCEKRQKKKLIGYQTRIFSLFSYTTGKNNVTKITIN